MENKVLIKLTIPELDRKFDIFIPVNEIIWKIKKIILKSITDLTGITLDPKLEYEIFNKDNSKFYKNNEIVIDTDIRNGCELILLTKLSAFG
ncbi:MAG: hypothetical protein PUB18_00675 [bacterium]|nr:hypothetical protein [bacterium]